MSYCGPATFINQTRTTSPNVLDCDKIHGDMRDIIWRDLEILPRAQPGEWQWAFWTGTCLFAIRTDREARLGSDDVGDLIRDSIIQFRGSIPGEADERVGAQGITICAER